MNDPVGIRERPLQEQRVRQGTSEVLRLILARDLGLPEAGTLAHKRLAALIGVAPLNRDSGTLRGKRLVCR